MCVYVDVGGREYQKWRGKLMTMGEQEKEGEKKKEEERETRRKRRGRKNMDCCC